MVLHDHHYLFPGVCDGIAAMKQGLQAWPRWASGTPRGGLKSTREMPVTRYRNIFSLSWIFVIHYWTFISSHWLYWEIQLEAKSELCLLHKKKGPVDTLIFWWYAVRQQYDMPYWCKTTFGLYLGLLKTPRGGDSQRKPTGGASTWKK